MNLSGPRGKKDLNVELNLLPVFDVLSVCICFLLMTVVWIEVKSLETKQVMGGSQSEASAKRSSLWVSIEDDGRLSLTLKPGAGAEQKSTISSKAGQIDFDQARAFLKNVTTKFEVGQILPTKTTKYDHVIRLMDLMKQVGIKDIGLSPI